VTSNHRSASRSVDCWICGAAATTGEHKTKRSDIRAAFGNPTQSDPIYLHDAERPNQRIGSPNAKLLKSPGRICAHCNNTRTQPNDQAWETLSAALRNRTPLLVPGNLVHANHIFHQDTSRKMLGVHLYFVKLFGCHIAGSNSIPIEISGFARAIMQQEAHPCVYLTFGCGRTFAGKPMTGMSHMHIWRVPSLPGEPIISATWFYDIEGFSVCVTFAAKSGERLDGAWHPRQGTTSFTIADFREVRAEDV
jgi:hypothetical protein